MRANRRAVLGLGFGLAGAAALSGCAEFVRDFIYYPPLSDPRAPLEGAPERISVSTTDGLKLTGGFHPPRGGRPVIVFFHGNASDLAGVAGWLNGVQADGLGLLMAEYRGYFGNPGTPSEAGLALDAEAFFAFAAERAGGADRVIVAGHSLGGGVAFGLCAQRRTRGLLTIGTFTATTEVAPAMAAPLIPDRFANNDQVAKLAMPLLIAHGDRDNVIPFAHGEALAAAAQTSNRAGAFLKLSGVGHSPDRAMMRALLTSAANALDEGRAAAFTDGAGGVGTGFGPWRTA